MKNQHSKTLLSFFLLTFFLLSCDKEIDIVETEKNNGYDISAKDALEIAKLQISIPSSSSAKSRVSSISEVKTTFEIKTDDNNPTMYIVNFEKGFVIVSGDKRLMPILAFSENNSFPIKSENYPSGLVDWLQTVDETVKSKRKNKEQQTPEIESQWNTFLEKDKSKFLRTMDGPPPSNCIIEGQITTDIITHGPLLNTKWGQGVGYNDQLTNMSCSSYSNGRPPTGCVATAVAQIMRYHQHPNTYSWSSMNNLSGSSETQLLMKNIGSAVSMSYACSGSGASLSNAASALTGTFGYASATYSSSYNFTTVENNINANKPVILEGWRKDGWWIFATSEDGHAWVADGVRTVKSFECKRDPTWNVLLRTQVGLVYLYFNMNWGWNGSYDGWYGYSNWNPGSYTFNYGNKMVTNITKP